MTPQLPIPPEKMAVYRATAQRREQERRALVEARRERALALAQTASQLLKQEFGAARVVLFGSTLAPPWRQPSSTNAPILTWRCGAWTNVFTCAPWAACSISIPPSSSTWLNSKPLRRACRHL